MVRINGKLEFKPEKRVFNGTHVGFVEKITYGDFKGKEIVGKFVYKNIQDFLINLYLGAHDRYLTYEEQQALLANKDIAATRFDTLLKKAIKSGEKDDFDNAANMFNDFSLWISSMSLIPTSVPFHKGP